MPPLPQLKAAPNRVGVGGEGYHAVIHYAGVPGSKGEMREIGAVAWLAPHHGVLAKLGTEAIADYAHTIGNPCVLTHGTVGR